MRTRGEQTFERYLDEHGLNSYEYEKSYEGKQKRPDYTVTVDGCDYLFDVKDYGRNDLGSGFYDPYPWIREQIEQGRRKFREYKGWPCSIVMFASGTWGHVLREPDFALGAMYGNFGIQIPIGPPRTGDKDDARMTFLGGGKMIRPGWKKPQNTTISALITLREVPIGQARLSKYVKTVTSKGELWWDRDLQSKVDFDITERPLGVIVWENAFATTPLPRELFRGRYDERWGKDGRVIRRVFLGKGVAEYYELRSATA